MIDFKIDEFDFDAELKKINEKIKKPNVMICGAIGVGKSSLVNDLFGEYVAKVGEGSSTTKGIQVYSNYSDTINLIDSEGYEIGTKKQEYYRTKILSYIDNNIDDFETRVHAVIYCISAANKRVHDLDKELMNEIHKKKIPASIVITQVDKVSEQELDDIIHAIKQNIISKNPEVPYFTYCICSDYSDEIKKALQPYVQKEEIVEWSLNVLPEVLQEGFVSALKDGLKEKKKHINKFILPMYTASAATIAVSPIPFSDSMLLIPIQLTMLTHILNIYGLSKIKGVVTGVLEAQVTTLIGKMLVSVLGNIVKVIPGIGSVVGSVINTTVASALTFGVGYATSEISYKYANDLLAGKTKDILEYYNEEAFTNLFNIGCKLYKENKK